VIDSHERNNETAMIKNRTTKLQERVVIVKFWEIEGYYNGQNNESGDVGMATNCNEKVYIQIVNTIVAQSYLARF